MDYPKWRFGASVHLGFGTFGHWHICTSVHLYICISSFPLLSYKWGTLPWKPFQPFLHPIIVQIGDALLPKWGMIITQMGDDYYPNGGRIITQMGDALLPKWGTPIIVQMGMIITQMGDAFPMVALSDLIGVRMKKWCQNMPI